MEPSKDLLALLVRAISDPGSFTPRRDDLMEPTPSFVARAVATMLVQEFAPTAPAMLTQDNRCTANIAFFVQVQRTTYGADPLYSDDYHWLTDEASKASPELAKKLDALRSSIKPPVDEDGQEYDKSYYFQHWETVMVSFTEDGAKEYLRQNGHNLHGETRIYGESFHRCPEMLLIRNLLVELAEATKGKEGA